MHVILIVANDQKLTPIWARHVERLGNEVHICHGQDAAVDYLSDTEVSVIVLDLMLEEGSAIAVADYASYRWPNARVVFVTANRFFSNGAILQHIPNAAAIVPNATPPSDLAEIISYHGR